MVSQLVVHPCSTPLRGSVPVPADPVVTSIALGVAACAAGTSRLLLPRIPPPVLELAEALRLCGLSIDETAEGLCVEGRGLEGLRAPERTLDTRGAPLAASILAGLLGSRPFESELWVDEGWADRVLPAFAQAHAVTVKPLDEGGYSLRLLATTARPAGVAVRVAGAFPHAKVALLLGALRAASATTVQEALISADHCERLLDHLRVPVQGAGLLVTVHPPRDPDAIEPFELPAVGDLSAAGYLAAAAVLVPGSHVTVRQVGLNPTRTAWLEVFRNVKAPMGITPQGDALSEPWGELSSFGAELPGGVVAGELGARLGDDFVPVALLGAIARGPFELEDLELGAGPWPSAGQRDVARLIGLLRAFGLDGKPTASGLALTAAPDTLRATQVTTGGDPRLALAASVLALRADGPSRIDDVDCLTRFFPRWVGTLRALGAHVEVLA